MYGSIGVYKNLGSFSGTTTINMGCKPDLVYIVIANGVALYYSKNVWSSGYYCIYGDGAGTRSYAFDGAYDYYGLSLTDTGFTFTQRTGIHQSVNAWAMADYETK